MLAEGLFRSVVLAASIAVATASTPAYSQTAGPRVLVGSNPLSIAVNPVTNKVYVANSGSNNVSIINNNTGTISTVAVGAYPAWVAVNPETNRIYVSSITGANTSVIDGASDTVSATLASGGGGWTAINPFTNTTYVLRYGTGDEVNVLPNDTYLLTSATRSFQPIGLAVNPTNNWIYIAHRSTGDVVAMDMTNPVPYPPLKCPDGSGGFRPQPAEPPPPPTPDPYSQACIDVPGAPVAVAINPVSNRIYALSDTNQISTILGTNHTFTSVLPTGTLGTAKAIAVNPVTNKIYAAYSRAVVVMDGGDGTLTVIPTGSTGGGPAAIGVNVYTNMVYVPNADGSMLVINGTTGGTNTISISAGANGIAVDPFTNAVYVLDAGGGVTTVTGASGSATSTGITTSITPLAGNTGGTSGSITVTAGSTMTPAAFAAIRKVYYRFGTSGPWSVAAGTGPYTASYSGLSPGTHTLQAVATNGLDSPSVNTDMANVPVIGNVASYSFTVSAAPPQFALNVTKAGSGSGTVTSSPSGINCGTTCSASFDSGSAVTLTAAAASGSVFSGWTGGGCSGTGACTVTLSSTTSVTATFAPEPARVSGVSTRMQVLTGDNVMIAGFIIGGSSPKTVVVRARGPSLGVSGALADPTLTLVPADGSPGTTNDDWGSAANAAALSATGFQPANAKESAIMMTLNPGAYTAIVSGVGGSTGVAIVEVYEIDRPDAPMVGISTRGRVATGDNVLIGGFVIQGSAPQRVVVRARGRSLGVSGALQNPTLTLVPADGSPGTTNDDWGTAANAAELTASGFQPGDASDSAILITLNPGAYTAVVSGVGGTTGVAIVEVYPVP